VSAEPWCSLGRGSSRRRGLMLVLGCWPRARAAAASSATRCSYRRCRSAAPASSWALACCSRASRLLGLASSIGSSSPRARPCWRSSAWPASAASRRIWVTSSSSLAWVRLARSAALAATLVPSNATTPRRTRPGGGAQLQRLDEEAGQGLLVADAEARDGHVVGGLVAGQHPEGELLDAAPLDLPGGPKPPARPRSRRRAARQAATWGRRQDGHARRPGAAGRTAARSSWSTTSRMNHARWSVGSQSRRSGGR
jgi:hypothetical protein